MGPSEGPGVGKASVVGLSLWAERGSTQAFLLHVIEGLAGRMRLRSCQQSNITKWSQAFSYGIILDLRTVVQNMEAFLSCHTGFTSP